MLASFPLKAGDAVLTTNHAYGACKNALDRRAASAGAEVIVAEVPFPIRSPAEVLEAVERAWTPKVRLALLDHITSPTGLVFPLAELVKLLEGKGVACLVDGAHAPGMVPLALNALGASYYTGNCHSELAVHPQRRCALVGPGRSEEGPPSLGHQPWQHGRPSRSQPLSPQFD